MCIDFCGQSLRSSPHPSEGNGGHQEGGAYQDTEDAADERISMLDREDTGGKVRLCVHNGEESEGRKSERQDDQTQVDR